MRQQQLLEDERVARHQPLLREAARHVGYAETRRRGTVGGSIAFGAPWAELSAAAVALDATIEVRSTGGDREIEAREFFLGPNETALARGELVVAVRFPAPGGALGRRVPRGQRAAPRLRARGRRRGRRPRRRRQLPVGDGGDAADRGPAGPRRLHRRDARRRWRRRPAERVHAAGRHRGDQRLPAAGRAGARAARAARRDGERTGGRPHERHADGAHHDQRQRARGGGRAPPDAGRLHPRGRRPEGHAPRLRARLLRQLQRRLRRRHDPLVPHVRRAGRRPRDRDRRGALRARRRALASCSRRSPTTRPCSAASARRRCC